MLKSKSPANRILILAMICMFTYAFYNLFKTDTAAADPAKQSTVVSIDAANNIYLQDNKIEFSDLASALKSKVGSDTNARIFVRGDEAASYGRVMGVIGAIRSAGYNNIAVVAKPAETMRMTLTEDDELRRQIDSCWNIPIGAEGLQKLIVTLSIDINPDRTVQKAEVTDQRRYKNDPAFHAMADSALRAVRSPKCNPLLLPLNKYEEWKQIIMTFDPRDVM